MTTALEPLGVQGDQKPSVDKLLLKPTPKLEALPVEIIEVILNSTRWDGLPILNKSDLCSLRSTNRQLQIVSFETFATRLFTTRKHMVERRSLDMLLELAEHSVFSDYVREVVIGPERINEMFIENDCPEHDPHNSAFWDDGKYNNCCPPSVIQYVDLLRTQCHCEDDEDDEWGPIAILGLALQKFRNLQVVRLDSYADMEDEKGRPQAWGAQRYYELAADLKKEGFKCTYPEFSGVDISSVKVDNDDFMPPPHMLIDRGGDVEGLYRHYDLVFRALQPIQEKQNWALELHYDFTPRRWPRSRNQEDLLEMEPIDLCSEAWKSIHSRVKVLSLAAVFEEGLRHQGTYRVWVQEFLEHCSEVERLVIADNLWQGGTIANAFHSAQLRSLTIQRARFYKEQIQLLLLNHANTLEELVCEEVRLRSNSGEWISVFRTMTRIRQLRRIRLSNLYLYARNASLQDYVKVGWPGALEMHATTAEQVQKKLSWAVNQSHIVHNGLRGESEVQYQDEMSGTVWFVDVKALG